VMVAARSRAVVVTARTEPVMLVAREEAGAAHNGAVEGIVEVLEHCEVVARRRIEIRACRQIESGARRRVENRIAAKC
jgi:hypothetical protein